MYSSDHLMGFNLYSEHSDLSCHCVSYPQSQLQMENDQHLQVVHGWWEHWVEVLEPNQGLQLFHRLCQLSPENKWIVGWISNILPSKKKDLKHNPISISSILINKPKWWGGGGQIEPIQAKISENWSCSHHNNTVNKRKYPNFNLL